VTCQSCVLWLLPSSSSTGGNAAGGRNDEVSLRRAAVGSGAGEHGRDHLRARLQDVAAPGSDGLTEPRQQRDPDAGGSLPEAALDACRTVELSRGRFERLDDQRRAQQRLFADDPRRGSRSLAGSGKAIERSEARASPARCSSIPRLWRREARAAEIDPAAMFAAAPRFRRALARRDSCRVRADRA